MEHELKLALVSVFVLLCFLWSNVLILNDEELIILQVKSISSGFSINPEELFSYQGKPYFTFRGDIYAPFSYFLPLLTYPAYLAILLLSNFIFVEYIFFFIPASLLIYISKSNPKFLILSLGFLIANVMLFTPIYRFEDWAPLFALHSTNIILMSATAGILYSILRRKSNVDCNIALISSFLFVFATPIAYWTLTGKSHALSLFLIVLSIFFFFNYQHQQTKGDLIISSFLAGLTVWARPIDGLAISTSILLFTILRKRGDAVYTFTGIVAGYMPCAAFSAAVFGIPLPVEIIGNLFSGTGYVSTELEIPFLILFGINNQTLGLLNYSPILVLLIHTAIQKKKQQLSDNEKFLIFFALAVFLFYFPFIHSGIVETRVRDYRFLLPIYIPAVYFIAPILKQVDCRRFCINLSCIIPVLILLAIISSTVYRELFNVLPLIYTIASLLLAVTYLFFNKFSTATKTDLLTLSLLPLVFVVTDRASGYFSPYDVHFVFPILDDLVRFLVYLKVL